MYKYVVVVVVFLSYLENWLLIEKLNKKKKSTFIVNATIERLTDYIL